MRQQPTRSGMDLPTKQQLDELEAIMQRMLALPVHPTEEVAPLDPLPELPTPKFTPLEAFVAPPSPTFTRVEAFRDPLSKPDLPVFHPISDQQLEPAAITIGEPASPPRQTSRWLRRFASITFAFDACVGVVPGGQLLASRAGRFLMGWSGIFMLLSAIGWILVEGMGWIW